MIPNSLVALFPGLYKDSVELMQLTSNLKNEGHDIDDVAIMMGTQENKSILKNAGYDSEQVLNALPSDCILVVKGKGDLDKVAQIAKQMLFAQKETKQGVSVH